MPDPQLGWHFRAMPFVPPGRSPWALRPDINNLSLNNACVVISVNKRLRLSGLIPRNFAVLSPTGRFSNRMYRIKCEDTWIVKSVSASGFGTGNAEFDRQF
jgi:hypothetical protein